MGWISEWFDDNFGTWFGPGNLPADHSTDTPLERTRFMSVKPDQSVAMPDREVSAAAAVREIGIAPAVRELYVPADDRDESAHEYKVR